MPHCYTCAKGVHYIPVALHTNTSLNPTLHDLSICFLLDSYYKECCMHLCTHTLTVPDVPRVNIVPCYSNDDQELQELFLEITMNRTEVSDEYAHSYSSYC